MKRRLMLALALTAVLAVLAAACGGGGGSKSSKSTSTYSKPKAAPTTQAPTTQAPTTAAGPATLKAASSSLGMILVDASGKTLYLYANDQGTTSAVPANILAAWPPLTVTGRPVAGDGVDGSKFGTAQQPDGQTWVTYNGHLLYRFSGDSAPGDTKGHKLGNVWYAVSQSGDRIG